MKNQKNIKNYQRKILQLRFISANSGKRIPYALALSEPDGNGDMESLLITKKNESKPSTYSINIPDGLVPYQSTVQANKITLLNKKDITNEVAEIDHKLFESILKAIINHNICRYFHTFKEPSHPVKFIAGESTINYAGRIFDEKEMLNLVDASLEFWLTFGRYSKLFENKLSDFLGVRYTFIVNSGSSANLLAFMSLTSHQLGERRIQREDEIVTVAACFPTTVAPIIQYGAIPVFVDVDLETLNIDVKEMEKAISPKTKAVFLSHTLGNPFNIKAVKNICDKYKLWLIEDNCDSLGSKYYHKYTGTWGHIGTSSFYPSHHITMGEGGAVYTDNELLKKIILSMRDWGRDCYCETGRDNTCSRRFSTQHGDLPFGYDHKYVYSHFGYNFKATEMQAAIGCAQLTKVKEFAEKRKRNFSILYTNMKEYEKQFILPKATPGSDPSWFGFPLTVKDDVGFSRNELTNHLESRKIQTRNLFAGNVTKHPCFKALNNGSDYRIAGNLKNTDKIMNSTFWIGIYPGITDEILAYMSNCIKAFIENRNTAQS